MAEATQDNIKEKVISVREVMPGRSNNEIVLVLQYYDYNVEKAIQAYLEDGAKEALTEWHFSGNKGPSKKKKNKKKPNNQSQSRSGESSAPSLSNHQSAENGSVGNAENALPNGDIAEDHIPQGASSRLYVEQPVVDPTPDLSPVSSASSHQNDASSLLSQPPLPQRIHPHHSSHSGSHTHGHSHSSHHSRQRTLSERSTASSAGGDTKVRKPFAGLEKSIKDLQRQTTALERLRNAFDSEVDKAYKRIKSVFDEIRKSLNDREVEVYAELTQVKEQGADVFRQRQEKAAELKVKIERAERLSDRELGDLRADVKHFVSDRKVDEDLARTTRFLYDSDHMREELKKFGEIVPAKCTYSLRRPSVSSVGDSAVNHEDHEGATGSSLSNNAEDQSQDTLSEDGANNMTAHEMAELQKRLKNSLQLQGVPVKSPNRNRPTSAPVQSGQQVQDQAGDGKRGKNARRRQKGREMRQQENYPDGARHSDDLSSDPQSDRQTPPHQNKLTSTGTSDRPSIDKSASPHRENTDRPRSPRKQDGQRNGPREEYRGQRRGTRGRGGGPNNTGNRFSPGKSGDRSSPAKYRDGASRNSSSSASPSKSSRDSLPRQSNHSGHNRSSQLTTASGPVSVSIASNGQHNPAGSNDTSS